MGEISFDYKTEPFDHQIKALNMSAMKKNFAYFMEMGCVDGETEFLSNRGWIKFKDLDLKKWKRPLLVAEVVPGESNKNRFNVAFVPPKSIIVKDVEKFYHMTGRGVDMMLTEEHDMIAKYTRLSNTLPGRKNKYRHYYYEDAKPERVHEYVSVVQKLGSTQIQRSHFQVMTACYGYDGVLGYEVPENEITALSLYELRVMVAVMADGNFPNKKDNRCVLEFLKERKQKRFEWLCKKAGIAYVKEKIRRDSIRYQIIAPVRLKEYDSKFWLLSDCQKSAVYDEFRHWDGSTALDDCGAIKQVRFYTNSKQSADFIQHCCNLQGHYCSIVIEKRRFSEKLNFVVYHYPGKGPVKNEEAWLAVKKSEIVEGPQKAYCFRVPSGRLLLRRNDKVFITGNSGKTKVMIDNMAYLYQNQHITGAVIFAPKGVYRNWSEKEIPDHLTESIDRELLVWKAEAGTKYKRDLYYASNSKPGNKLQIMVFNIESIITEAGQKLLRDFIKSHSGKVLAIVDESTCIKNHKAKRTRAALDIGALCKIRRIATGSPITNSPLDLYSQMAFLDKGILGHGSYYSFKNTYAVVERLQTRQGQSYDKICSYKNLNILGNKLEPYSFRITKKECMDLPEKIYMTRDVGLTDEQIKIYKDMYDREVAHFNGDEMSVQVVLTKMLRLHQVLCGSFVSDDGVTHSIPNNRLTALEETLAEISGKAIIWASYLKNIEDIKELLTREYGADSFVTYYGATTDEDRVEAINKFQDPNSPVRFFVGNVQTAGRGITLTEASTVIYYSNNFSLEMRQQSEDRAHRYGQKNNATYVDLVVRGSLDEKIIKSLILKRNIANEVLHDELDSWIAL